MGFIENNRTRYSSPDLEKLYWHCLEDVKAHHPVHFSSDFAGYTWKFVNDVLPLSIDYWSSGFTGWPDIRRVRELRTGRGISPTSKDVKGPWFVGGGIPTLAASQASYRPDHSWDIPSIQTLRVLSPNNLLQYMGDLEALSMSASEEFLPREALAQILLVVLHKAGVRMIPPDGYSTSSLTQLYKFTQHWVQQSDLSVRICKNVQDRRAKRTTAESIKSLLKTYMSGGAANGMMWKRWTIRDKVNDYYLFWQKTEKQRKRLEVKGGTLLNSQVHKSPGDLLRELADEYDRRAAEWKKEKKS